MKFPPEALAARSAANRSLRARIAAKAWWVALLMLAVLPVSWAGKASYPTVSPETAIETLHDGLTELALRKSDAESRYEALRPLITATHDLAYIAEFTIRRQWRELTPEQRSAFVDAFERLSVMTYASRFGGLRADMLRIVETPPPTGDRAEVHAAIARPAEDDIPLEYLLHERDGEWRIINIVADGVSDLALKRAEYQRVLANGTIDDLVRHLDAQTARLK